MDKNKTAVIVPFYNQAMMLATCLKTVRETVPPEMINLVVVDDAVDQEESNNCRLLAEEYGAIYHRNLRNLGFIGSTIAGVNITDDPLILFLNSDISCHKAGWFQAMVKNMDDLEVGVVGAKLVFPAGHPQAGRIQHAGVATNNYGGVYHAFYLQPGDLPAANVRREVNVVTGGALLTRRSVWEMLGGWDPNFGKGVFEDVDYCRSVRVAGFKVIYEAAAELGHWESAAANNLEDHPLHSKNQENATYLMKKWEGKLLSDEYLFDIEPTVPPEIKLPPQLDWLWPIRGITLVKAILQAWLMGSAEEKQVIEQEAMLIGETFKNGKHVPIMVPAVVQAAKEADLVRDLTEKGFTAQQVSLVMGVLTRNDKFPGKSAPRKHRRGLMEPEQPKGI